MNRFRILTVAVLLVLASSAKAAAQERIVNKQDADRIFAFNKEQWNTYAKQIGYPQDWKIRLAPLDTGTGVMAYDPKTGFGLSVQPLYDDDGGPPAMLIVGNLYPAGAFPTFPDSLRQEMERAARADLGAAYDVSISSQRISPFGTAFDLVEIVISRAKR